MDRDPLRESLATDGDHEVLVRDHVRCRRFLLFPLREDDGPARVSKLFGQLAHLLDHERQLPRLAIEECPQLGDEALERSSALHLLFAVERGELSEPHPEDRLRLHLRESEALLEPAGRGRPISRAPDQCDHLVDMVKRQQEALDNVPFRFRPLELVSGPADDNLESVIPGIAQGVLLG